MIEKRYSGEGHPRLETMFLNIARNDLGYDNPDCKYIINLDSRFKYIDYEELVSARRNSQIAIWTASISVFLTLLGFALTYIFFNIQISTPIEIDKNQIDELKELKFQPAELERKIDDLIQKLSSTTQEIIKNKK